MNIVILTQVGGILKPIAWIMGIILNAIYEFFNLFGIQNVALCIFIFTFVIKMLMLPLTIKQQKQLKLQSKMSPELTAIQNKYKGKRDEVSLRYQQAETQEVYAKYGTSPLSGCLPLLITFPIMIALYRVIYAIPAYVSGIGSIYGSIAEAVSAISGNADLVKSFITDNAIKLTNGSFGEIAAGSEGYIESLIDVFAQFNEANWNAFFAIDAFSGLKAAFSASVEKIISINNLFGLSILNSPSFRSLPTLIIPVLAVVTQYIQSKLQSVSTSSNKNSKSASDNPMESSTKAMTTIMPLMSGVFCFMFPIGVGVYWIATALFTILQTLCINKYLDKIDLDDMIAKNVEKANKRRAKMGIDYGNKMAEVAKTTTKTYATTDYDNTSYKKNNKRRSVSGLDYQRSNVSYSASSIAANANLLAARNKTADVKTDNDSSSPIEEENK